MNFSNAKLVAEIIEIGARVYEKIEERRLARKNQERDEKIRDLEKKNKELAERLTKLEKYGA